MIYGLDEYYNELILEAKSPEEIKKLLEYQFVQSKGVPQEVLDSVFAADPTKKKAYTRWALIQWEKFQNQIVQAVKDGTIVRLFEYFKSRGNEIDITKYNFASAIDMLPRSFADDPVLKKNGNPNDPENDFDIVFGSNEWIIAVPHTYEADRKLGVGTKWCTAGFYGDNPNYWNRYSQDGPIWVNFDLRVKEWGPADEKEYPYTRYQFCFESNDFSGEIRDSDDKTVSGEDINMPKNALMFYAKRNPEYYKLLLGHYDPETQNLSELFNQERLADTRILIELPLLRIMPTTAHTEDWHLPPIEERKYSVYGENSSVSLIEHFTIDKEDAKVSRKFNFIFVSDKKKAHLFRVRQDCYEWFSEFNQPISMPFENDTMAVFEDNDLFAIITVTDNVMYIGKGGERCINKEITETMGTIFLEQKWGSFISLKRLDIKNGSFDPFTIIDTDRPINGEHYELGSDGKIVGKYFDYYINGDGTNMVVEITGECGGKEYASVYMRKNGGYCLYDVGARSFVFKHCFDYISFGADVCVLVSGIYERLFSPIRNEFLSPWLKCIEFTDLYRFLWVKTKNNEIYLIKINEGHTVLNYGMPLDDSDSGFPLPVIGLDSKYKIVLSDGSVRDTGIKVVKFDTFYSMKKRATTDIVFDGENVFEICVKTDDDISIEAEDPSTINTELMTYTPPKNDIFNTGQGVYEINYNFKQMLDRINNPFSGELYD